MRGTPYTSHTGRKEHFYSLIENSKIAVKKKGFSILPLGEGARRADEGT